MKKQFLNLLVAVAVASFQVLTVSAAELSITERVAHASKRVLRERGLRSLGVSLEEQQANELIQIFDSTRAAYDALANEPNAGSRLARIQLAWAGQLDAFILKNPGSAYDADICLELGKAARLRLNFSKAIAYYERAWNATKNNDDQPSPEISMEAASELGLLYAAAGRNNDLQTLENEAVTRRRDSGVGWWQARELREQGIHNPSRTYRCGLLAVERFGQFINQVNFDALAIANTPTTVNGSTAPELVQAATAAGLPLNHVLVTNWANLPTPCIVHLKSEHFIFVARKDGDFYEVKEPLSSFSHWLILEELFEDASGCILLHQNQVGAVGTRTLTAGEAAQFRGRATCPKPGGNSAGNQGSDDNSCAGCLPARRQPGMAELVVQEPEMDAWILDTPFVYQPGYGPELQLDLAYTYRRSNSPISGGLNNGSMPAPSWGGSWWSWIELNANENSAYAALQTGEFASFEFSSGSTNSVVQYRHNLKLQKVQSGGVTTALILFHPDGRVIEYGHKYTPASYKVFHITKEYDASGNYTSFSYVGNGHLTTVTAADGVTVNFTYDTSYTNIVLTAYSSLASGATVSLGHGEAAQGSGGYYPSATSLTSITDPVGIYSKIGIRADASSTPNRIITPYGTTQFDITGHFTSPTPDRFVWITHPNSATELYAYVDDSSRFSTNTAFTDWPAFSSEIPTGTPVNTLDTAYRTNRNTFHWSIKSFAHVSHTNFCDYTWTDFKNARIRHWLASTAPTYSTVDTLSWEQQRSHNAGTTAGHVSFYDYSGKNIYYYWGRGTQVNPSDIARVMPDGTTTWKHFVRNSFGHPTELTNHWNVGTNGFDRAWTWSYSSDDIDVVEHRVKYGAVDRLLAGYGYHTNYSHLVTLITNALSEVSTNTYDSSRRLSGHATPASFVTTNYFGTNGFISKTIQYEDGPVWISTNEYTWVDGEIFTHTDARGLTVTNTWDDLGRKSRVDYPDGTSETWGYTDSTGAMLMDVTSYTNRLGYTNGWTYNSFRQVLTNYDALGRITAFGYCDCGERTSITNAVGSLNEVTSFAFDDAGRLTQKTGPNAVSISYSYDSLGRLEVTTDALGSLMNHYDNLDRLIFQTNYFHQVFAAEYDEEDRIVSRTDSNGVVIEFTYDDLGRVLTRTFPDGGIESFGYTANVSGPLRYTNQVLKVTTNAYNKFGQKTMEVVVGVAANTFTFSGAGDLLTLTDGKSQTTTWAYDIYGRVATKQYADGATNLIYSYDALGRLTNRWSAAKGNTAYSYDAVGNLTSVNYPTSADLTFAYDALNRSTNEVVSGMFTNSFTYYAGGAINSDVGPWPTNTVTYYYNSAGLRSGLQIQQPVGSFTNGYSYDQARRLSSVTSHSGSYTYTYWATNGGFSNSTHLIRSLTLPPGSFITNLFANNARLTKTSLKTASSAELNDHEYLYNTGNQRTKQTRTDDSYVTYTYDDAGQLRTAYTTNSGGSEITSQRYFYGYDAAWNMIARTNNATVNTYPVNNLNQATNSYTFDSNGNATSPNSVNFTYSYDDENRLIEVVYTSTAKSTYAYDARGRLRKRQEYQWYFGSWSLSSETRYIYDGMMVIQERNGSDVPQVTYTRGTDLSGSFSAAGGIGGMLARSSSYQSGSGAFTNNLYYHADANGNITYLMKTNETVGASYTYDPYGRTITSSGTSASANVYRFSSKEIVPNWNFYYFGYRFYDPTTQRWLNRDPIEESGGLNLYQFALNAPTDICDPDGRRPDPRDIPGRWTPIACPDRPSDGKLIKDEYISVLKGDKCMVKHICTFTYTKMVQKTFYDEKGKAQPRWVPVDDQYSIEWKLDEPCPEGYRFVPNILYDRNWRDRPMPESGGIRG